MKTLKKMIGYCMLLGFFGLLFYGSASVYGTAEALFRWGFIFFIVAFIFVAIYLISDEK